MCKNIHASDLRISFIKIAETSNAYLTIQQSDSWFYYDKVISCYQLADSLQDTNT